MKGLYLLAKSDYQFAKLNYGVLMQTTDQLYINKVAYFTQQAVEKLLKFILEINGINYPKTRDISRLVDNCINNKLFVPQKIVDMDRELTAWCTATRYDCDFYVSKRHIESVMQELEEWIAVLDKQINNE